MSISDNIGLSQRGSGGLDRLANRPEPDSETVAARRLRRALERYGPAMPSRAPLARLGAEAGRGEPPSAGDDSRAVARVDEALLLERWCAAVRGDPALCAPVVFDLVGGGLGFSAADRRHRRRNGWARGQLGRAVRIYAQLSILIDTG